MGDMIESIFTSSIHSEITFDTDSTGCIEFWYYNLLNKFLCDILYKLSLMVFWCGIQTQELMK